MKALIETTIQINRIFRSKKRETINEFMRENECYCSTYVLGEFKANMVHDFLTVYGIVRAENNFTDVIRGKVKIDNLKNQSGLYNVRD